MIIYKNIEKLQGTVLPVLLFFFLSIPWQAFAQDESSAETAVVSGPVLIFGLSPSVFYLFLGGIVLELITIIFLARAFHYFSGLKKEKVVASVVEGTKKKKFSCPRFIFLTNEKFWNMKVS